MRLPVSVVAEGQPRSATQPAPPGGYTIASENENRGAAWPRPVRASESTSTPTAADAFDSTTRMLPSDVSKTLEASLLRRAVSTILAAREPDRQVPAVTVAA